MLLQVPSTVSSVSKMREMSRHDFREEADVVLIACIVGFLAFIYRETIVRSSEEACFVLIAFVVVLCCRHTQTDISTTFVREAVVALVAFLVYFVYVHGFHAQRDDSASFGRGSRPARRRVSACSHQGIVQHAVGKYQMPCDTSKIPRFCRMFCNPNLSMKKPLSVSNKKDT